MPLLLYRRPCRLSPRRIPQDIAGFFADDSAFNLSAFKDIVIPLIPRGPLKPGIRNVGRKELHPSIVVVAILYTLKASYGLRVDQPDVRFFIETNPGLSMQRFSIIAQQTGRADLHVFRRESPVPAAASHRGVRRASEESLRQ